MADDAIHGAGDSKVNGLNKRDSEPPRKAGHTSHDDNSKQPVKNKLARHMIRSRVQYIV